MVIFSFIHFFLTKPVNVEIKVGIGKSPWPKPKSTTNIISLYCNLSLKIWYLFQFYSLFQPIFRHIMITPLICFSYFHTFYAGISRW